MEERIKTESGAQFPERGEEEDDDDRNVSHYGTERSDMANATVLLVATMCCFLKQEISSVCNTKTGLVGKFS